MDKDTEIYKSVIRSQNGSNGDIAKVVYVIFKDKLLCKPLGGKQVWYEKINDTEYALIPHFKVRHKIFERTKIAYNQTADFLYRNAFTSDFELSKPHYLLVANAVIKTANQLSILAHKNNLFKEVEYLFLCN